MKPTPSRSCRRQCTRRPRSWAWEEKIKGTIEAGKLADLIVLDTDPLTSPPEKLLSTRVDLTIIGGEVVYDRSQTAVAALVAP
jgi:predicted amidohydrolase YtcJ